MEGHTTAALIIQVSTNQLRLLYEEKGDKEPSESGTESELEDSGDDIASLHTMSDDEAKTKSKGKGKKRASFTTVTDDVIDEGGHELGRRAVQQYLIHNGLSRRLKAAVEADAAEDDQDTDNETRLLKPTIPIDEGKFHIEFVIELRDTFFRQLSTYRVDNKSASRSPYTVEERHKIVNKMFEWFGKPGLKCLQKLINRTSPEFFDEMDGAESAREAADRYANVSKTAYDAFINLYIAAGTDAKTTRVAESLDCSIKAANAYMHVHRASREVGEGETELAKFINNNPAFAGLTKPEDKTSAWILYETRWNSKTFSKNFDMYRVYFNASLYLTSGVYCLFTPGTRTL